MVAARYVTTDSVTADSDGAALAAPTDSGAQDSDKYLVYIKVTGATAWEVGAASSGLAIPADGTSYPLPHALRRDEIADLSVFAGTDSAGLVSYWRVIGE